MELFKKSYLSIVILSLLEKQEEMYGYKIAELIDTRTKGQYRLRVGTLYPLLNELEKKGFIESDRRVSPDGPQRKYVKLTQRGKDFLGQEKKNLLTLLGLIL